jgi:hypothetical protein
MELPTAAIKARNLLIGGGAYYLSWFLANPLAIGIGKLTNGITYSGDFEGAVLLPLVIHLPEALIASVVGASVVWLVESNRPIRWAIVPTFLYALAVRHFVHWAHPPTLIERVGAIIGALFPAIACMITAIFAARRRTTLHVSRSNS